MCREDFRNSLQSDREGDVSWDRETTGTAQSGSGVYPDVCYHVRVQGSQTPGPDKLGQEEGFSHFRWKDGSRKDVSSPHCCLCGLKGRSVLAVLPAVRMEQNR